ncbi:hypothetical protein T4D_8363 [Trichinella pseudospiralis]|uniref:Uncharacterized protein n=1 Tax=Trichinella pseudospiralis TaxID=6337 RepID=A0A0V1FEN7_TRIPS|nr:hypothetical protein T4D_8363 [Trichinella pseudospiralis]
MLSRLPRCLAAAFPLSTEGGRESRSSFLPQSSQFEEVAVQAIVEPRQLGCSILRALLQADHLQHVTRHHLRHSIESIVERSNDLRVILRADRDPFNGLQRGTGQA